MKRLFVVAASVAALAGCGDSAEKNALRSELDELKGQLDKATAEVANQKQQLQALGAERDGLKRQVEELSVTAPIIYAELQELIKKAQLTGAKDKLSTLQQRFSLSPEFAKAQKDVAELESKIKKQEEERKRLAAAGFMGLPASGAIKNGEIQVTVGQLSSERRFVFDRYDDSYHYNEADRDHKFLVATMSVTAEKGISDPNLFGFAAYAADGETLRRLGEVSFRLSRWSGYATYLGNYSDSRNDFAKTSKINFNIGVQLSDEDLKRRPIYLVASTAACISRSWDRFGRPPVSYSGYCANLRNSLKLDDFLGDDPSVVVVRRFE
ncbi:MAG TPA: hypothetical protein PK461_16760 [Alcaligenes faecalis]|nr:hypothetical protein [Alcaligenes faecalis]